MNLNELDILANWNGKEMPLKDVTVSVLDRAFLFGDSVYEVIRLYGDRFFRLDDHMDRLEKSLASMKIELVDLNAVQGRLESLKSSCGLKDALAYIQVTRGVAKRVHHYPGNTTPNVLIYIDSFSDPFKAERENGAKAVTYGDIRWGRNDIKATNLAANCMAASYARENGCFEVIFIDKEGFMTEGSHTSMFGIKDGRLLTAPASSNVLPGITKRQVLEIAENIKLPLEDVRIKKEDIYNLDELFLAGTSEEVIPIVKVDDKPIGSGKPGPIVQNIYSEFRSILGSTCSVAADH